ncbi:unnamed protein product [Closterium sp. Naga37s-1]|nr:unnamed protein product [Closterium sp. Naga37s-1]
MRNSYAHFSPPNGDGPALTPPQELAAAAACRAELQNALQQWAAEARWREAEVDYQAAVPPELPSPRAQLTREALSPASPAYSRRHTADSPSSTTSTSDNGGTSTVDETLNAPAESVSPGSATAAAPAPAAAAGVAVGAAAAAPAPAAAAGAAVGAAAAAPAPAAAAGAAVGAAAAAPAPAAAAGAAVGAAAAAPAPAAAAEDPALLLCSEGWQRAAMARAATSAYVARAVKRNATSLARIEAGVDAVCRGVREIEARLSGECSDKGNAGGEGRRTAAEEAAGEAEAGAGAIGEAGSGAGAGAGAEAGARAGQAGAGGEGAAAAECGTWPEACWPVPHMPFSDVTVLPFSFPILLPLSSPPPALLLYFCLQSTRTHKLPHVAHSHKQLCDPPFPSPFTFSIPHVLHSILPDQQLSVFPFAPLPPFPSSPLPSSPLPLSPATSGRRFLVFAYSLEQLSNTRAHLVEAGRFAQATNRTLVLPKGSRSRLSLSCDLPLCACFDLSRLDAHWISPEFFLHLARAAVNPPFAKASPSVAFVHLQTSQVWRLTFTQGPLANMLSELMVYGMGHAPSRRNTVDVTTPVNSSALFQQLHKWWHRDVLVWVKTTYDRVDFHLPTDDISFKMLPYSQTWHAMAHQAMARLPPQYIAVHYRSEFIAFHLAHKLVWRGFKVEAGVLEELMTGCMEAARDLINGMKRRHNISAVFIAADVPFDDKAGSVVRSDSWKDTTWMFQGQKRVLEAPREKLRWLREQVAGTVMVDELMPAVNHYDPGIVAILDKLLCVHAHVFLAGSITCGGSRGFEQDITQHRSQFNKSLSHRWVSRTDKLLWQSNGSSAGVG